MENKRRGNEIFLGVIGVATLLVAIIGATFAFFGANAASNETAVSATGAVLMLGYAEDPSGLKHHLIPAEDYIAHFAATDTTHIGEDRVNECIDDNGNEVCGVYNFTIGNPSFTTKQGLYGSIKISSNEFTNLWFEIIDETGTVVVQPTIMPSEGEVELTALNQTLDTTDETEATGLGEGFVEEDASTYPVKCVYDGTDCTETNVRNYKLVLWIEETGADQTEADSGKTFAAGITFTSANDTTGVTGVISAAIDPEA